MSTEPGAGQIDKESQQRFLLPRPSLLKELSEAVQNGNGTHLIVVGRSGVGKSMLLSEYVSMRRERRTTIVDPISYVGDALEAIIGREKLRTDPFFEKQLAVLNDDDANEGEYCEAIKCMFDRCLANTPEDPQVIVFDQAERLSTSISLATESEKRRIIGFLEAARARKDIRIIFVIRSEYLAGIVSLIPDGGYKVFFIDGIDLDNETTPANSLGKKLKVLGVNQLEYDDLVRLISKNGKINTFVYQLSGYLVESVGIKELLRNSNKFFEDERFVVDVYIEKLLDEYGYLHSDHMRAADLEVVLFATSCFNKRTGEAVDQKTIGKITHLSERRLKDCARFLSEKDVIGEPTNKVHGIRIAHDVLIDQMLAREPRTLRADRRIAIEQIIERRIEGAALVDTLEETHPFFEPIRRNEDGRAEAGGAIETALLWLAAVLYVGRIAYPTIVYEHLHAVNQWLNHLLPNVVVDPTWSNVFFIPIAFTQYIWVIFMYGMNKGFFYYLHKKGELKCSYYVLQIAGPLGAFLGFALSFAPALFIIPIAIPGAILASVYLYLYFRRDRLTVIYKYFGELGVTTWGNMIIAVSACFLLIPTVKNQGGEELFLSNVLIIYFVCGLFCYFAYQMSDRQGSELGRNGMLTIYDAGRRRLAAER